MIPKWTSIKESFLIELQKKGRSLESTNHKKIHNKHYESYTSHIRAIYEQLGAILI